MDSNGWEFWGHHWGYEVTEKGEGKREKGEVIRIKRKKHRQFKLPKSNTVLIPENIKVGKFITTASKTILERNKTIQTEELDNSKDITNVNWKSQDTFELTNVKVDSKTKDSSTILVRIISWDDNHYICHYLNDTVFGVQECIRIK